MEKHVSIKDEHNALTSADRELIKAEAVAILERYRFTEVHLSFHIKTAKDDAKHLTHVKVNLSTDQGNFHVNEEGYNLFAVCENCLFSLRTQLEKNAERASVEA